MCIELSILVVPCSNLLNIRINFSFENIQFHLGGIMLQALSLEAQVDGALQTASASGEYFRIGMFESFLHLLLIFVEEILITKA